MRYRHYIWSYKGGVETQLSINQSRGRGFLTKNRRWAKILLILASFELKMNSSDACYTRWYNCDVLITSMV